MIGSGAVVPAGMSATANSVTPSRIGIVSSRRSKRIDGCASALAARPQPSTAAIPYAILVFTLDAPVDVHDPARYSSASIGEVTSWDGIRERVCDGLTHSQSARPLG